MSRNSVETELNDSLFTHHAITATLRFIYKQTGRRFVPVAVSNRHVHLNKSDMEALFGVGYELKPVRALVQPRQYTTNDTVTLAGPRGRIEGVRVLWPLREATQVEVSVTDTYKIGISTELRMSGDVANNPKIKLVTENGSIDIASGVIVAARHLHMTEGQAVDYGLTNGQAVKLKKSGSREVVFGNFVVRSGSDHELEAHIDTDEANAALIEGAEYLEIVL